MNNDDLVQNYFLKNIINSLHDTYNYITEYITSDNSNLDNIVNYENYNLLISIINFSNLITQDLNKFKTNEIYIDDNKRRRDEWIKYYSYIIKNFKVDLSLDLIMIITLKETVDNQTQRISNNKNTNLVEIYYLYYNSI